MEVFLQGIMNFIYVTVKPWVRFDLGFIFLCFFLINKILQGSSLNELIQESLQSSLVFCFTPFSSWKAHFYL